MDGKGWNQGEIDNNVRHRMQQNMIDMIELYDNVALPPTIMVQWKMGVSTIVLTFQR